MDKTNNIANPECDTNEMGNFSDSLLDMMSNSEKEKDVVSEKKSKSKLNKKLKKLQKTIKKYKSCENKLSKKNKKLFKENARLATEISFHDKLDAERIARIKAECQRDTAVFLLKLCGVNPAPVQLPENTGNKES